MNVSKQEKNCVPEVTTSQSIGHNESAENNVDESCRSSERILGELGVDEMDIDEEGLSDKLYKLQQALNTEKAKTTENKHLLEQSARRENQLRQALDATEVNTNHYRVRLEQSDMKIQELSEELDAEEDAKEEFKQLWKKNAAEFNIRMVNDRGFKPLDDKAFIDKVSLLRRNIRDFAYQHFNNWPIESRHSSRSVEDIAEVLDLQPSALSREFKLSSIVRAYIWAVLDYQVFTRNLVQVDQQERMHQFELWKARTSTLLQSTNASRGHKKWNGSQDKKICDIADYLSDLLPVTTKRKDINEAISMIWNDAVGLDMIMNTQASGLILSYGHTHSKPLRLDDDRMQVESERALIPNKSRVTLVLAPALVRKGDIDGKPLAQEVYLLKMLVSCDNKHSRTQGQRNEEKEHTSVVKRMEVGLKGLINMS
ncbi:hypothetical protein G7Z17_g4126 [Cylindrodendrum hubeiense]|uniref:Uncharacterized protein n=1 Tax=Cylindrodendrum hubeiense TaxID=595255 RepID=A0A9P5LCX6_9HYPO|nr:hypothetical protein G7Z17_g4126 [Cylindrodendrum hubeiense]